MIDTTFRDRYQGTSALARPLGSGVVDTHAGAVSMPRAVAGGIGAVVLAFYKTVPGVVEGLIHSSRRREEVEGRPSTGAYTVTSIGQSMALGAAIGTAAGPFGTAMGTGAGFLVGVLGRVAESKSKAARGFVATVDNRVDAYLTFNDDAARPAIQRAVEGIRVGTQSGFRQGLSQGWDAGVGLIDATEGALVNLKDALFGR